MAEKDVIKGQEKMSKGQEKMSDILLKMKGIDEKRLAKIEQQNELFKERQTTLDEQKAQLESLGLTASENKEFSQAQNKLTQQKTKFEAQQTQEINRKTFGEKVKDRAGSIKNFEGLKDSIGNLGKGLAKGIGGFFNNLGGKGLAGLKTVLATAAITGFLIATIAFLNSEYWETTKDFIVNDMLPVVLKFKDFLVNKLFPAVGSFFGAFGDFADELEKFKEDPSVENAKGLLKPAGTIALGLGALSLIFAPFKTIGLATSAVGKAGAGLVSIFSKGGVIASSLSKVGGGISIAARAAATGARFLPVVGQVLTAAIGIFGGAKAAIQEVKDGGSFGDALKAGIGGAIDILSFGFIKQEKIEELLTKGTDFTKDLGIKIKGIFTDLMASLPTWDDISAKIGDGMDFVSDFVQSFLDLIPTFEDIKALLPSPKEIIDKVSSGIGDFFTFGDNEKRKEGNTSKRGKGVGGKKEVLGEPVTTLTTTEKDFFGNARNTVIHKASESENAFSNSIKPDATLKTSTNPNNMSGALDAMQRMTKENASQQVVSPPIIINNSDNSQKSETKNTFQESIVDNNGVLQAAGVYF
tara:strand:- start:1614 stop:3359 length:1746 start_codon:yes stop_codon:yes gene_type:complete